MKRTFATILLALSAVSTNAAIVYDINRTIDKGTVTGFIETDGTIGVLGKSNILDWSITLSAPNIDNEAPDLFDITSGNTILRGNAVDASEKHLTFDFTTSGNSYFLLMSDTTGNFWCLQTKLCTDQFDYSEQLGATNGGAVAQYQDYTGSKIVFASAVPVPAAFWLFGSGLLAFMGFARSAKRSRSASQS